jgi:hypothetical protein
MPTSRFLRAAVASRAVTGTTSVGGSTTTTVSVHLDGTVRFNDRNGTTQCINMPANYTTGFKNKIQPPSSFNNSADALYALIDALIARA